MGLAATEDELRDRVARFIKAELKRANLTYAELASRLEQHGVPGETENSIKSKLKRGTFAATFLVATLAALELEEFGWRICKATMKRLRVAVLALLVAVIVGLAFAAVRQSQKQPAQATSAEKTHGGNAGQQEKETLWQPATWEPITAFTASLVLVAAVQAALFVWQLIYMRAGVADAKTAADAAVAATRVSLGAETAKLFAVKVSLENDIFHATTPVKPVVSVTVQNFGRTPAFVLQQALDMEVCHALPAELTRRYVEDMPPGTIIMPNDEYDISSGSFVPRLGQEEIAAIKGYSPNLWVYGYVCYQDFLGIARWLNFRAVLFCKPIGNMEVLGYRFHLREPGRKDDCGPD